MHIQMMMKVVVLVNFMFFSIGSFLAVFSAVPMGYSEIKDCWPDRRFPWRTVIYFFVSMLLVFVWALLLPLFTSG